MCSIGVGQKWSVWRIDMCMVEKYTVSMHCNNTIATIKFPSGGKNFEK